MSDISLHITVKEENGLLFKKCIRKLLESTFILQERDGKLYDFVSRESNRQDISEYLRIIGFDLLVDDKAGVAMLIASEADMETGWSQTSQCSDIYQLAVSSASGTLESISGKFGLQ